MQFVNNAQGAPTPVGAYSQAVVHSGVAYLAGQVGIDPATGAIVEGGLEAQTKQVLKNLSAVLSAVNSSPSQILMTTIFLAEIASAKTVNELYGAFVDSKNPPARQTVAVKDLPLGALVEISLIAATGAAR